MYEQLNDENLIDWKNVKLNKICKHIKSIIILYSCEVVKAKRKAE